MKRVLVIGATGYLGKHLVKELKQRNHYLRVLVRNQEQAEQFKHLADDVFIGQATQKETLTGLCDSIDVVCSSLGITRQKDGLRYEDVDFQANLNVLQLAEAANVQQFLYVSVLNAHKMAKLKIIQAKERFVEALKASEVQHIIIRPSGFFSDMTEFLDMAAKGRVYIFGDGSLKVNPISGIDLAKVCADKLGAINLELNVGGPKVYTQKEIAELAFSSLAKPTRITYIPLWLAGLAKRSLSLVMPEKRYGPIEFFLTALSQPMMTDCYGKDTLELFYQERAHSYSAESSKFTQVKESP